MADVFVEGGKRQGRTLANERQMLAKIAEGHRVVTRNPVGVYFEVSLGPQGIVYSALVKRPDWVPA